MNGVARAPGKNFATSVQIPKFASLIRGVKREGRIDGCDFVQCFAPAGLVASI
jgi:hypothetical protein